MDSVNKKVEEDGEVIEGDAGGNGKKPLTSSLKELSRASFEHAFTSPGLPSALNMLAHPGTSPAELGMRTIYPEDECGAGNMALAISFAEARAEEYGDVASLTFYHKLKSNLVSIRGLGRSQLVDAITGERRHNEAMSGGLGQWLRKTAFGDKEKKDE